MNVTCEIFRPVVHYEAVCRWWKAEGWPKAPLDHLPRIGFVTSVDDAPAAAGWIYQTDSAFCLFEFMVANPEVRGEARAAALDLLFEKVKEAAKEMGYVTIFSSVKNDSLLKRLEAKGFNAGDRGMTNLTCRVGG